jgi:hypothetical protein
VSLVLFAGTIWISLQGGWETAIGVFGAIFTTLCATAHGYMLRIKFTEKM